ncbi:MAG: response regulator [Fuerstiella sp.]|nr:response regulator [Fuerstiella sp.]MCP4507325.1 response regulator [Fuerstiella sp.]
MNQFIELRNGALWNQAAYLLSTKTIPATRGLQYSGGSMVDNQRLIALVLSRTGATVTRAENGRPFDVILMDMLMPVFDGYGTTGKLRQSSCTGPIIPLTAHAVIKHWDKCINAGCDDDPTRPIDLKTLISMVPEWEARQPLDIVD